MKAKVEIWERLIPLDQSNHQWDIDFWQAQKPEARFNANWSLVVDSHRLKGKKIHANTFRLQRTIEIIKHRKG
jgi:hypothetical protein